MVQINIEIKGLRELRGRLKRFPRISGKHVSQAINKSVFAIEAEAKPITPVKTGLLRGSYSFGRVLSSPFTLMGRVKPNASYAQSVHDLHPPGQRYIRPSLNKNALAGFLTIGQDRAERQTDGFFQDAANNITGELAR